MNNTQLLHRARVRALFLYSNALERGDFETISKILKQAEHDPLLEGMIAALEAEAEIPAEQPEAASRILHNSNGIEQVITIRRPSPDGQTAESDHFEEDKHLMNSAEREFETFYPRPRTATSRLRWLTLIAAALVVIVMGLLTIIVFRAGFVSNPLLLNQSEPTPTPSPTPIPTPEVITKDNADKVELLQVFGYGVIYDMDWAGDGAAITLLTDKNYIAQFNPDRLDKLPHFIQPANAGGQTSWYADFALNPDGKLMAISQGPTVSLYDRESDSERASIRQFGINLLTFNPDGTLLAGSSRFSKKIYLWDAVTGEELNQLSDGDASANALAFSPDGGLLAVGYADKKVRLWEAGTGKLAATLTGHTNEVMGVGFKEEGKSIASVDKDGRVLLWDWNTVTGTQRVTIRRRGEKVNWAAFSPDGSLLATAGDDHTIRLWNLSDGTEKYTLTGHTDVVKKLAFSTDGSRLASYSSDETLRLWEMANGAQVGQTAIAIGQTTMGSQKGQVATVQVSPDGKTLARATIDGLVQLWDVETGTEKNVLRGHRSGVYGVAYSPDGRTILSYGEDGIIRLWDVEIGTLIKKLEGHKNSISTAFFSPDGTKIVSAADTIRLWNVATGDSQVIEGHNLWGWGAVFSTDGKLVIFHGTDHRIRLWDITTNTERFTPQPGPLSIGSLDRSSVGTLVTFGGTENQIWIWDYTTDESRALVGHTAPAGGAFSPNGELIVSCGDDACRLWDVQTRTQMRVLKTDTISTLSWFAPDGTKFILEPASGAIELWGLPPAGE